MTEQEIRDNKPDGATHYIDVGHIVYYRKIGSFWYEVTITGNDRVNTSLIHKLKPIP